MRLLLLSIVTLTLMQPALILAAELPSATETTILAALSSGRPTVADFGARSCIPCRKMAPILESLAGEWCGRLPRCILHLAGVLRDSRQIGILSFHAKYIAYRYAILV